MKTNQLSGALHVPVGQEVNFLTNIATLLVAWLNSQNNLFSSVMEEPITNRQACLMAHATLALVALISSHDSAVMALFTCVWFAWSLSLCKKGGLS